MAQWRIKEISTLTKISIRMLRHYDKIGLLKPSMRSANGYRWYAEEDLVKLQQIVALRFFGFELKQIQTIFSAKHSVKQHLLAQQQMLKSQAEQFSQAHAAIGLIIEGMQSSDEIIWTDLVKLIERYHMTQEAKKTWAQALNTEQMAEYIAIKQQYPQEFAQWESLIEKINTNQAGDPESTEGCKTVEALLALAKKFNTTGAQQRHFNASIMKSIKEGKIKELALTKEGHEWQSKAAIHYWMRRWDTMYQTIVSSLDQDPTSNAGKLVAQQWRELITESFAGTPSMLSIGTMLWQNILRAKYDIAKAPQLPSMTEIAQMEWLPPILFNPEAISWLEAALSELES